MAEATKARLARMRKRLAIPRHEYLAAVERHERRAWAERTDPARDVKLREAFAAVHANLERTSEEHAKRVRPMPPSREPDPALFDSEADIQRDDVLIGAYLSDHPTEHRRPMARGNTHAELLDYWEASTEGRRYLESYDRQFEAALRRLKAKYLPDGGAPASEEDQT